jgi:hypothetical protein
MAENTQAIFLPGISPSLNLRDLVSKRRERPYQAGWSKHWLKIKNRTHPAMDRVMDSFETPYRTS